MIWDQFTCAFDTVHISNAVSYTHLDVYKRQKNNKINIEVISEKRQGLRSAFVFWCEMCHLKTTVWAETPRNNIMDVNTAGSCGTFTLSLIHI